MKTFVVYNSQGFEVAFIKAKDHNAAEKKAISLYGPKSSVAYTEI